MENEKMIKVTKSMILSAVKEMVGENLEDVVATVNGFDILGSEVVDYCNTTLTQLETKAAKAKAKAQEKKVVGDELKERIKAVLTETPQTREEVYAYFAEDPTLSVSKIGARLTQLVKSGDAVKEETKTVLGKKMVYKLA